MNVKLLLGIVLFVVGIIMAVIGITGVGEGPETQASIAAGQESGVPGTDVSNLAVPAIAGLSLAIGGLLIGLSMGNWKHPRTRLEPGDEVVNPEGYHKMKHV